MANKYEVVDQILTSSQATTGTYNVMFTTLNINDNEEPNASEAREVITTLSDKIGKSIEYKKKQIPC